MLVLEIRLGPEEGHFMNSVVLIVALLLPAMLPAQVDLGSITGIVQDSSKAVVPGVIVVATSPLTGVRSEGKTQANGVYLIRQLQPGTYSLAAQAAGFKHLIINGLKVDVGSTLTQ